MIQELTEIIPKGHHVKIAKALNIGYYRFWGVLSKRAKASPELLEKYTLTTLDISEAFYREQLAKIESIRKGHSLFVIQGP